MSLFALSLVLTAAISHAAWNLFVKGHQDRLAAMVLVLGAGGVVGLVLIPFVPMPTAPLWGLLLISMALHGAYNINLYFAYRFADLSLAYPLARGAVPLLVLAGAFFYADQRPENLAIAGLVVITLGIMTLAASARAIDVRGLVLALMTSCWIAGYTVIDGMGVRLSNATVDQPLTFIAWSFAMHGLMVVVVGLIIWRGRLPKGFWRLAPVGFLSPLAYGLVLWAQQTEDFAPVSALRETSVVFAALLGILVLGEGQVRLRLTAASLVAVGAVFVAVA